MQRCEARTRAGQTCRNWGMSNGRCRMHGGKTPNGLASPNTKTGLYSAYLPATLSTQYQNLLTLGQDLFRIDDETAAITTLIQQQLDRIEDGESGAAWDKLQGLYDEMAILGQKPDKTPADVQRFNVLFVELGKIINGGSMQYKSRDEAVGLMEQKRRLVSD